MILHPLTNEERATLGGTHRAIITYADLVSIGGANNTATIPLFTTPNNSDGTFTPNKEINVINSLLATPFSGTDGTLVSTAMTVGDSGNNARLLASQELNAAGSVVYGKGGALASNVPYVPATQTTINAYFTATAAKALNTLTAGEVHLILDLINGPVPQSTGTASQN
jgi:hypothetical protein